MVAMAHNRQACPAALRTEGLSSCCYCMWCAAAHTPPGERLSLQTAADCEAAAQPGPLVRSAALFSREYFYSAGALADRTDRTFRKRAGERRLRWWSAR